MIAKPFSQFLAIATVLVCCAAFWLSVLHPLHQWKNIQYFEYSERQTEVRRLQNSIRSLSSQKEGMADIGELDFVWVARQRGEAAAKIQSRISTIAKEANVSLRSMSADSSDVGSSDNSVIFRLEAEMPFDRLVEFIAFVESNKPALIVDRAMLRRLNRSDPKSGQPVIFGQFDVIAPISRSREAGE